MSPEISERSCEEAIASRRGLPSSRRANSARVLADGAPDYPATPAGVFAL